MKVCTKCGEEKALDEFRSHLVGGKMYRRHICKICLNAEGRLLHSKNKAHENKQGRLWYKNNKAKAKASHDKWIKSHPEHNKESWIRNRHTVATRRAKQIDDCADTYIKNQLRIKGFEANEITPELIGAHRNVIKIKRLVMEIQK